MNKVTYNNGRARQVLGSISLHEFSGTFDAAIAMLQKEKSRYNKEYVQKAGPVRAVYANPSEKVKGKRDFNDLGFSSEREEKRDVRFDVFYLDLVHTNDYDGERTELLVIGERDVTVGEAIALEKEEKQRIASREEHQRKMYEQLKAQFEKQS